MRFENVYCSQCGQEFGPGNEGYGHCKDHRKDQLQVKIKTDDTDRCVYVDQFDEGLWLSIQVSGGSTYCSMSREQAQQLYRAIGNVLEAV